MAVNSSRVDASSSCVDLRLETVSAISGDRTICNNKNIIRTNKQIHKQILVNISGSTKNKQKELNKTEVIPYNDIKFIKDYILNCRFFPAVVQSAR